MAKQQGKLIPVLLELLRPEQFPMGFYIQQSVNLSAWKGNFGDPEWAKLRREVELKLTPLWVQRAIHELEAQLVAERARREAAEARDRIFEAQVVKEAQEQIALKRQMERAQDEVAALQARLEESLVARTELGSRLVELQQRVRDIEATGAAAHQLADDERRKRSDIEDQLKQSEKARLELEARGVDLQRRLSELQAPRTVAQQATGGGRITGVVKYYNTAKGYGFIQPDNGGKDVFLPAVALEVAGIRSLNEGDRISFVLEDDRRGRGKQAGQLQKC